MSVSTGQIVAERDFLCGNGGTAQRWHIYIKAVPTTDWFRLTYSTANSKNLGADTTYPALDAIQRGKVYAGSRILGVAADAAATSGAWADATFTLYGFKCNGAPQNAYREYTKPASHTYCRVWYYHDNSSRSTSVLLEARDSGGSVLSSRTFSTQVAGSAGVHVGAWFALPASTSKIRITNQATGEFDLAGIDWINTSSEVDPDTSGSMMFDLGYSDPSVTAFYDSTAAAECFPVTVEQGSDELACYWASDGGAYSSAKAWGGLGHQGVDTVTKVFEYQTGTADWATWSPAVGAKQVCEAWRYRITAGNVYQTPYSTKLGDLAAVVSVDACGLKNNLVCTTSAAVDLFELFALTLFMPIDLTHVMFGGDTQERNITAASALYSGLKSQWVRLRGGANKTVYTVQNLAEGYSIGSASFYTVIDHISGQGKKLYIRAKSDSSSKLDLASGSLIRCNWALTLQDQRAAFINIPRAQATPTIIR